MLKSFFLSERKLLVTSFFAEQVMLELQCNRITWFRPSKNTTAVFSATKQMKRIQGHGCWKASQWEKVLNAILRVTLKYMKRCFFLMNEMLVCMQKTDFMFRAFLRAKNTNAVRARTLMLCLVQLSKWRECKATMLKRLFLSERKVLNAILRVQLKYMKDVLLWNEMLFGNAEDRFSCVRAFLQSKSWLELQCTESLV